MPFKASSNLAFLLFCFLIHCPSYFTCELDLAFFSWFFRHKHFGPHLVMVNY
jgi:hypothetical protein